MTRISSALKCIARISSAFGTDVSEPRRKQTEKAAKRGWSDGSS